VRLDTYAAAAIEGPFSWEDNQGGVLARTRAGSRHPSANVTPTVDSAAENRCTRRLPKALVEKQDAARL
jgi:hypothetical protein